MLDGGMRALCMRRDFKRLKQPLVISLGDRGADPLREFLRIGLFGIMSAAKMWVRLPEPTMSTPWETHRLGLGLRITLSGRAIRPAKPGLRR
jgi:hypothetical protein